MSLNSVFEPPGINKITLPKRVVFPACQTNYVTSDGFVSERLLRMYEKLAKGGSGLVIVGGAAVSDNGTPNTNALKINHDRHIAGLKELFSLIKKNSVVSHQKADLVAICRSQIVDPFFVKKSMNSQPLWNVWTAVRVCSSCMGQVPFRIP